MLRLRSVILLEIDAEGVSVLEFESDAPRSIHVDRIARWPEASQRMKVEPGNVHFRRADRRVEAVKPRENTLLHPGVDFPCPASLPQLGESLALESPDHPNVSVNKSLTSVNNWLTERLLPLIQGH